MTKEKDILARITESFPLLEKVYNVYDQTLSVSENEENTLRRSVEMTTLELLELIVVSSRQSFNAKRETLRQCANKIDTLKVFVDLGVQTGSIPKNSGQELQESINEVGKMVGGWIRRMYEATIDESEDIDNDILDS